MWNSENLINYKESQLHYFVAGSGPMPLLLFHGFGQDHQVFESWTASLPTNYRLFAFDLYFHGQSHWPSRKPLEKSDWKLIMGLFLKQEKIENFALAGYSLGGKFALAVLEAFPEKVKNVLLIAPDGIKTSPWYSLATYPTATRQLFKSMVLKPGRFYGTVRILSMLGIVNRGILRFAESQMDTEEKRRRVYFSWVYFRHLKFNMKKIAFILNGHEIPLTILVGKYDKVIPPENMNALLNWINQKQFVVLDSGHNDLITNAAKFLTGNQ